MKIFENIDDVQLKNTVVVLGNFDGIHKGHLTLLTKATQIAKARNLKTVFFTFHPHPSHVLAIKEVMLISTDAEKQRIASDDQMDYYVQFPFTIETAHMEAETFIHDILFEKLGAKAIVVGDDYSFGRNRKGNIQMLKAYEATYGFELHALEKLTYEGREISSTWIREAINAADLELANILMGRPYFITGRVIKGAQLGRKIGFPTANIKPDEHKQLPHNGVYITKATVKGKDYYGLTNVGTKPTIDIHFTEILVETYIFDFNDDIYDEQIDVHFYHYLRTEDVFNSLDELVFQMNKDVEALKAYFNI